MAFRQMTDMMRTPEEKEEVVETAMPSTDNVPSYPYGLCIRLDQDCLEKLGIDEMPEIGDMIHLFAMAKVTSISASDSANGYSHRCVELQITHLGLEDEDEEEEPSPGKESRKKRYGE